MRTLRVLQRKLRQRQLRQRQLRQRLLWSWEMSRRTLMAIPSVLRTPRRCRLPKLHTTRSMTFTVLSRYPSHGAVVSFGWLLLRLGCSWY
jgi:hypothetical protein